MRPGTLDKSYRRQSSGTADRLKQQPRHRSRIRGKLFGDEPAFYPTTIIELPVEQPGDSLPGGGHIPAGIAPTPLNNFSPRFGLAYSPSPSDSLLSKLTGGPGKTSIRLGGGRFFTSPQGLTVAYPTGNPPYGLTYTSPESPVMETPFIGALTGTQYVQQFPVKVPSYNVSPTNPDNTVDWSRYYPISGAGSVYYKNKTSYVM